MCRGCEGNLCLCERDKVRGDLLCVCMCEGIFCLCVITEPLRVSVRGREKVIGEILCVCVF